MNQDHAQPRDFAACLNLLFEASAQEVPDTPGKYVEYTNAQVADAINQRHGDGTITGEYIRKLRRGDSRSPSVQYASVLAEFFQVPLDTFNAIGGEIHEKVMAEAQRFVDARRRMLRDDHEPPQVAVLARAARRLSPAGQRRAAQFVQQLEQVEAMENNPTAPSEPPVD